MTDATTLIRQAGLKVREQRPDNVVSNNDRKRGKVERAWVREVYA